MGWIPSFFSGYNGKTIRNVGRTITAASGAYSLGSRIYKSWYKQPRRTFPRGDPRAYQSINKQLLGQRVFTRRRIRRGGFYDRRRYLRRYYRTAERGRGRAFFKGTKNWVTATWPPGGHYSRGHYSKGYYRHGTAKWRNFPNKTGGEWIHTYTRHARQSRAADTWNHRGHY